MIAARRRQESARLVKRYTIRHGGRFRLSDVDPNDTASISSKEHAAPLLADGLVRLQSEQEKLYAQGTWAVLLVFQAMDAAGKDSTIKHVMSGVNPQGCQGFSFKAPTREELAHDFLWRCTKALPERGRIGIFNRSYYEEVLVVRVHPELVANQRIPLANPKKKSFWKGRYKDINQFERHLVRNGTLILKFFLNVSKSEQKKRFLERLNRPDKHWKFSASDLAERAHWGRYMRAYSHGLSATSTEWAPWYVIPADHKWTPRAVVADVVTTAIRSLDLKHPEVTDEQREHLAEARR